MSSVKNRFPMCWRRSASRPTMHGVLVDIALTNGATDSVTVLLGDYRIRPSQAAPTAR
jgi:hypothetical protein